VLREKLIKRPFTRLVLSEDHARCQLKCKALTVMGLFPVFEDDNVS